MEDHLLINTLIVGPLLKWVTSANRKWNKKNPTRGVIFALILLFIITVIQNSRTTKNHYQILGLKSSASKSEIATAYRRLSLKYHPDKNSDPTSGEKFRKILDANEVLGKEKLRNYYRRFGMTNVEDSDGELSYHLLLLPLINIAVNLSLALLLSNGDKNLTKVTTLYVLWAFSIDVYLRFDVSLDPNDDFLSWMPFFNDFLPFEKIRVLNGLFVVIITVTNLLRLLIISYDKEEIIALMHSDVINKIHSLKKMIKLHDYVEEQGIICDETELESEVKEVEILVAPNISGSDLAEAKGYISKTSNEYSELIALKNQYYPVGYDLDMVELFKWNMDDFNNMVNNIVNYSVEDNSMSISSILFILFWVYRLYDSVFG